FFPLDPAKTVALFLYNPNQYGQGKQSLDDYIDSFYALSEQAGCQDGLQLCLTFYEGLHPTLMEHIDNLAEGCPDNSIYLLPVAHPLPTLHASLIAPPPSAAAQSLPPGIPMKVDASHQCVSTPLLCCHCKKPGDFVHYCPQRLKVCYLSPSEQEELLLQLLAAKNTSGDPSSDASLVDLSSKASPAAPFTEQEEDF
ncbi:hypothetical protein C0995_010675, partial [Termitomyces sp. Mi166